MNIYMAGIDHHKADISVREHFAFTRKRAVSAMEELKQDENITGCIILSTCNRTELWLSTQENFPEDAADILCRLCSVERGRYASYLESRSSREAIEHLFYLTAGLKSQIIGEDQILTQVGDALTLSRDAFCTDQVLETLFRQAITAGKKVKTQAPMPHGNTSAADAAVEQLSQDGYELAGHKCLVIGNGMMGKLTAQLLMKKGAAVTVTIRQYRSGIVDTPFGVTRMDYDKRYEEIPSCDFVFSATTSPNLTITRERLAALSGTKQKVFVDLAVPRDMETQIDQLDWVKRYDMDSFQVDTVSEALKGALTRADEILQAAIAEYEKWYEAKDAVPEILSLSSQAAKDVVLRLEKPMKKAEVYENEELQTAIETAAGKVVGKLLFGIRDSVDTQTLRDCLTAMKTLYENEE